MLVLRSYTTGFILCPYMMTYIYPDSNILFSFRRKMPFFLRAQGVWNWSYAMAFTVTRSQPKCTLLKRSCSCLFCKSGVSETCRVNRCFSKSRRILNGYVSRMSHHKISQGDCSYFNDPWEDLVLCILKFQGCFFVSGLLSKCPQSIQGGTTAETCVYLLWLFLYPFSNCKDLVFPSLKRTWLGSTLCQEALK